MHSGTDSSATAEQVGIKFGCTFSGWQCDVAQTAGGCSDTVTVKFDPAKHTNWKLAESADAQSVDIVNTTVIKVRL